MAYKHVIRAKTKNLFKLNDFSNSWLTIKNNTIRIKKISDLQSYSDAIFSPLQTDLKSDKYYRISAKVIGEFTGRLYKFFGNSLWGNAINNNRWQSPFTLANVEDKYGLAIHQNSGTTVGCTLISDEVFIYDIMLEENDTAFTGTAQYQPYNYLQSNKRMIKVSDVCQLLDKSKYPATRTTNGVTFTNNGDGTFTVNGTATNKTYFDINGGQLVCAPNKKYLLCGCPTGGSWVTFNLYISQASDKGWLSDSADFGNGNVFTGVADATRFGGVIIFIVKNQTVNNLVFKPQLFDLTEMFGPGHEPATVAEFRQRFPNEYYPYSPQCWLTSYKSAVVCKTRNLFDINSAVPYTFSTDNPDGNLIWLKDGIYTTRMNNYNIGSGLRIKDGWTLPAGVYTLSVKVVDCTDFGVNGYANIGFHYKIADGTWHVLHVPRYSYTPGTTLSFTIRIPENLGLRLYLNYQNMNGQFLAGYISYKDIQVEQGSTATSYVPYQHL